MVEAATLWTAVRERTDYALRCGALQSIPTTYELIEQNGISFVVRRLTNLVRKDEAHRQQERVSQKTGQDFNPFLPYETDLFVTDLSATHVCLLNKFNVVDYHLLLITRAFELQDSLLTIEDFEASWLTLSNIDGLIFYNSGKVAGASQRHKHLQVVPLPLTPTGDAFPIASLFPTIHWHNTIGTIPALPFVHAVARMDSGERSPAIAARATLECYYTLLKTVGLWSGDSKEPPGAYNLLITRQWMVVVPRSQEDFQGIAVNALGFSGALLVRNDQQLAMLKELGPLQLLAAVGVKP